MNKRPAQRLLEIVWLLPLLAVSIGSRATAAPVAPLAVEGAQKAQVFTVTYTDGTQQELAQNLSDWFQPQNFPGETRAVKMAYRNVSIGAKDIRPFYLYSYRFSLPAKKTVKSLTLPQNPNVKVVAVSVVPVLP